ncbi:MAG: 3-dehydroquinate synthase [Polyangiaceae bacterium]|nr:3-dehydroquinate synthase [Polyangiaceae bacterium]
MKRPLLLNGFMATGKSTVGRLIAQETGTPFVDLDAAIEAAAGASIPEIFNNEGEAGFRDREHRALSDLLETPIAQVIALGGGALLMREIRLTAMDRGVVVCLHAELSELITRAGADGSRPLLAGPNPQAQIERLLTLRSPAYEEAHCQVNTGGRDPTEIAEEIRKFWQRDPMGVAAGSSSYAVDIGRSLVATILPPQLSSASSAILVTDANVGPLHGDGTQTAMESTGLSVSRYTLTPGEEHKTIAAVEKIWKHAQSQGADRSTIFVGLGGGVCTDMTGFASASWMRGTPWIGLPTTMLAMVDASVGGKTAVDLGAGKNAVGAFWQPRGVICDVDFLQTESARGFKSALAEVVKTALIGDSKLFELLEKSPRDVLARDPDLTTELVRRCIRVKSHIVGLDAREGGVRATLNLGHTLGHALEAYGGYGKLTHGEAISLGLVAALQVGVRLGLTPPELSERTTRLLQQLDLPTDLAKQPLVKATSLLTHDKKRIGKSIKFIAAKAIGDVLTISLPVDDLAAEAAAIAKL